MSATVFFNSSNELATISNTFSVSSTPTDPTTVTLTVTSGQTRTVSTYTYAASQITRTSAGVYTKDITCNEAGTWQYQWDGTGAASDTVGGTWEVEETELGRLYCTVEALKSRLAITTTTSDLELHAACFGASRWLEQYCQRTFSRTASNEVRTFETCNSYELALPEFNDLVSVTTLKTDSAGDGTYETTWSSTDYQLLPHNTSGPEAKPYTRIKAVGSYTFPWVYTPESARADRVQLTGVYGWPAVPHAIKQAAQLMAAELFRRKDAPLGIAGEGEYMMTVGQNRLAKTLADPYRRHVVLVG
jgi:hypothetical protein